MDQMVLETQKWLNSTYGKDSRFTKVEESGHTGWNTINGLIVALQIELGIQQTATNFGAGTTRKFNEKFPNGIKQQADNDKSKNNVYSIIQGALWCKGYSTGSHITQNFYGGTGAAIRELKDDMGIGGSSTVTIDVMKALLSMQQFVLLKSYGGKDSVRNIQKAINQNYKKYTGIIPCDGLYGREMNTALIQILQSLEGYSPEDATGYFGNGTKSKLKKITSSNASSYGNWVWLAKATLNCIGYMCVQNNSWDSNFESNLSMFQDEYKIPVTKQIDTNTWMALLTSKGNPDRPAKACDCATVLNSQQAKDLKSAGYQFVGRYLTGYVGQSKSKALTLDEIKNIKNAGLSVFPIYQDGGYYSEYFANANQGTVDAQIAISAAKRIGIPYGSTIYFAVDFDAYGYQLESMILPYFKKISLIFNSVENDKNYKVGVYGPRLICSKVSNAGYAKFSFVADMSTGFSGNLGYPIPKNWAFDQFNEFSFKSSPTFDLDKDAYSGRDKGVAKFDSVTSMTEDEIEKENLKNKINIARTQFVYDVVEPLGLLNKLTSVGFAYNKEIVLNNIATPNMNIKTSMETLTELITAPKDSYNISIELNSDGTLSAACENKISKVTKDIRIKKGGEMIKNAISNIATSVKAGDIALTTKAMSPNQMEFAIEVMSKDLLPTLGDIDEYVTVIIKYLITFNDSKVKEPVFSEDGVLIGVAVIGILAICIFVPESIPVILEWLGTLGLAGAAA